MIQLVKGASIMWRGDYSEDDRDTCLLCGEDLEDVDDLFCCAEHKATYKQQYKIYLSLH